MASGSRSTRSLDDAKKHTATPQGPAYTIEQSETLGRYMVAGKDLEMGDIIFEELPIASGPQISSPPICPGCYRDCAQCGWPICSDECPQKSRHENSECELLSQMDSKDVEWSKVSDALMLHRCIALPFDSSEWKALCDMEAHPQKWIGSSFEDRVEPLIESLRKYFHLAPHDFETQDIQMVQAILYINAFEVKMPNVNIQAVYQLCCLLEHHCIPNTHRTVSSETLLLTVRAASAIPKGTHLSTSYCDIFWPTQQRQDFLRSSKFFACKCERCLDPTECGSYLSAFLCPLCPLAPVIPHFKNEDKNNEISKYDQNTFRCTNCNHEWDFEDEGMEEILQKVEEELQELDEKQVYESTPDFVAWIKRWSLFPTVEIMEEISGKNKNTGATGRIQLSNSPKYPKKWTLHPHNSFVWDACHTLFLLYKYGETVPTEEMKNKLLLGKYLLQSAEKITKGISRFRGSVTCEMALTRLSILMSRMDLEEKDDVDDIDMKSYAEETIRMLKEGLEDLQYEPQDQPEGVYYTNGFNQMSSFRELLTKIIPDLNFD